MTATTQTVREIALEQPSSIRVSEQFGIDYCCGGRKPLAEACSVGNLEIDVVIAALEEAAQSPEEKTENWAGESLERLSNHIVATHHAYVKRELPRLALLAEKVVSRHGTTKTELPVIAATLAQLDEELTHHLAKEEAVLFPYRDRGQSNRNDDAGTRCGRKPPCGNPHPQRELHHAPRRLSDFSRVLRRPERIRARPPPAHSPGEQYPVPAGH
jgi:regulator of cell morphogenesis and NO signaling